MKDKKPSTNEYTLGEAIEKLIGQYRLAAGLREKTMQNLWKDIAGPFIYERTEEVRLQGNVLYIKIQSAALRQELWSSREEILQRFIEKLGKEALAEVRFS
jgi:predicted nucleic acid-binding Zn ribbon protein